ncbi:MAG: xylose isomerase, partial [Blastocatellia bacterium]
MGDAFPKIKTIKYEGTDSKNPLSFKHYNANEEVEGKKMKDHLRFASSFWHTMRGQGMEIFGWPTMVRPWEDGSNSLEMALRRLPVFFEFLEK